MRAIIRKLIMKMWGVSGAVLGLLAVVMGAFGAHGVGGYFAELYASTPDKMIAGQPLAASLKYLADFKTAAEYQFFHSLALLFVAVRAEAHSNKWLSIAGWSFLLGILLFSGSLYVLTLCAIPVLGAITPIGGVFFLVGWGALAVSLLAADGQKPGN